MENFWTPKDYTPYFLYDNPQHTEEEIKAEYARLRKAAQARARRLRATGEREFQTEAGYLQSLPKLSDLKNPLQVAEALSTTKRILDSPSFSVRGIKKLHKMFLEQTGEDIPVGEVLSFTEYMKSWRLSAYKELFPDTNKLSNMYFDDYQEVGGSFANFYKLYKQGI